MAGGFVVAPKTEYENALERLREFFAPKRNDAYERHIFRQMKQKPSERIDVFVMRLRIQAVKCDFGDQVDANIIYQITIGSLSSEIRRKILRRKGNLEKIMCMIRIEGTVIVQQKLRMHHSHQQLKFAKLRTIRTFSTSTVESTCKINHSEVPPLSAVVVVIMVTKLLTKSVRQKTKLAINEGTKAILRKSVAPI